MDPLGPSLGATTRRAVRSRLVSLARSKLPTGVAGPLYGIVAGGRPLAGLPLAVVSEPEPSSSRFDALMATLPSPVVVHGKLTIPREVLEISSRSHFGPGVARLESWESFVNDPLNRRLPESERVELVNRWMNEQLAYVADVVDSWKSPLETVSSGLGDCEDYALAKYATLRLLGVPADRLSIALGPTKSSGELHAVVIWSDGPTLRVLDNRSAFVEALESSDFGPSLFEFGEHSVVSHPRPGVSVDARALLEGENKVSSALERLAPFFEP